jgi:putative transposon-encoded protein
MAGRIEINNIEFDQLLERKVARNNTSSGKVTIPKEYIGKRVYVVLPKEESP